MIFILHLTLININLKKGSKMSKRLSQLYGTNIYTEKAEFVGRVEDVILNIDKGEVMRLCLKSFKGKGLPSEEVKKILQEESIGYNEVSKVGDIILCKKNPKLPTKPKKKEKHSKTK